MRSLPRALRLAVLAALALTLLAARSERALPFLVVGDWGRDGHDRQAEVAEQMGALAGREGAAFVISTGDNFYDSGVESVDSPRWQTSYENVYRHPALQVPWYVVLGNHDYRGDADAQIAYTRRSPRWRMPARWYERSLKLPDGGRADFFFLDTQPFVEGYRKDKRMAELDPADRDRQLAWLDARLAASRADWRIVVGHHPVFSRGRHGDTRELVRDLKPLLDRHHVQLYLNGHDHDMQLLVVDGVNYVTSGAGSRTRATQRGPATQFSVGDSAGFLAARLTREQFRGRFVDWAGNTLYEFSVPQGAARTRDR